MRRAYEVPLLGDRRGVHAQGGQLGLVGFRPTQARSKAAPGGRLPQAAGSERKDLLLGDQNDGRATGGNLGCMSERLLPTGGGRTRLQGFQ